MNLLIRVLLKSLIPAFLVFIGKNDYLWETLLKEDIEYQSTQFIVFVIGLVWASLVIPYQYALSQRKLSILQQKHVDLVYYTEQRLIEIMAVQLDSDLNQYQFRSRVFMPKRRRYWPFGRFLYLTEVDLNRNSSGSFSKRELRFAIRPVPEGLVGKAFQDEATLTILDMNEIDEKSEERKNTLWVPHRLQIYYGRVQFWCAIPLFDNQKVYAVLSLEGELPIALSNERKEIFEAILERYAAFFDEVYLNI